MQETVYKHDETTRLQRKLEISFSDTRNFDLSTYSPMTFRIGACELAGADGRPLPADVAGGGGRWMKQHSLRACDVAIATAALVILSPLMLLAALAIKLDSAGPAIFRQRRTGLNGREFMIYKFRSMSVTEDGPKIVQACEEDPRVTRVGRILRQSSIDELPQLLNVVRGDMSLIGPRPHAVAHDQYYADAIANYTQRQRVKPGITGWAQVNGLRGETPRIEDMEKRIEFDLWYVRNRSLALDAKIIWRTCFEAMR